MTGLNLQKCAECRKPADFGITSSGGEQLWYCIPCGKKLAKRLDVPAFAMAVADAELVKQARTKESS